MRIAFGESWSPDRFSYRRDIQDPFQRTMAVRQQLMRSGLDTGHGWDRFENIQKHLMSEVAEFGETVVNGEPKSRQLDEMGDILYIATWMAAGQNVDPAQALHHADDKVISRYKTMLELARERWGQTSLANLDLAQKNALWKAAKQKLEGRPSN